MISAGIGIGLGGWVIAATIIGIGDRCRNRQRPWFTLFNLPRAFVGQCLAHIGFAGTVIGVVITSFYSVDEHRRLAPGESAELAGYEFHFIGLRTFEGPNYRATEGTFELRREGKLITTLRPQKRLYHVRNMPMTEAGISPGFTRDLYVSLGEPLDGGAWSVRMHFKPFVRWIWLGALLMAFGGLIAVFDPRLRSPATLQSGVLAEPSASD